MNIPFLFLCLFVSFSSLCYTLLAHMERDRYPVR